MSRPLVDAKLLNSIELAPEHVYTIDGPINFARMMSAYDLIDHPELKFSPQVAYTEPELETPSGSLKPLLRKTISCISPMIAFNPLSISFNARLATQKSSQLNKLCTGPQAIRQL